jgi:radical SAM/Cys-rich protein
MCNQTCKHCHVDAGPTRKEIMTKDTMQSCLNALDAFSGFAVVDLTGGAPEMNPNFRWFVEEIRARGKHVISRCNLTIIEANEKYAYLPEWYAKQQVEVVSSLPSFEAGSTDRQRGNGVFGKSITALKKLNAAGYGTDPKLPLNLVYNPVGAFLPGDQAELEAQFKSHLKSEYDVVFNSLFTITNMPISRFLDYLILSKNFEAYMRRLNQQFNPTAVSTVMCRTMISIGWDGSLYDCDFNQMLELKVACPSNHIAEFNADSLLNRKIVVNSHCYGCTAGAGSSCGGSLV